MMLYCIAQLHCVTPTLYCLPHCIVSHYTVPDCIVSHCIMLYFIVAHSIVPHCIMSDCIVSHCIMSGCILSYCNCATLYCFRLYFITLCCVTLYCTTLHCITLYCVKLCCVTFIVSNVIVSLLLSQRQIVTNKSNLLDPACHLPPIGRSNHQCIFLKPKSRLNFPPTTKRVRRMKPGNWIALSMKMAQENWENVFYVQDIMEKLKSLTIL